MKAVVATSRKLFLFFLGSILFIGISAPSHAGGGPENVFLLVNPLSRDSLTVANHYIDLRQLPPQNVFYLPWTRSKSDAWGSMFRKEILLPTLEEIGKRNLGGQIDYLIYSCDYPWRVNFTKDFPDEKFPPVMRPLASLTGATYLWAFAKEKRKEMFSPMTNFYYSTPRGGMTLSRSFRGQHQWDPEGRRTAPGKGIPYLLSTMLGVTDGRGNSVDEIIRYLKSAHRADGTKPKGNIYYVKNNSPRSTPRDKEFPKAVSALRLLGLQAEVVEGKFLEHKRNIMGVTCGAPLLNIAQSDCHFSPGALGDNLTSAGGLMTIRKLKGPDQTPLTDFLRFGAAGASGTVTEPLAVPHKFPSPFLHVHYARGCSLAEAFYQSVAGPYQLLIVGDPLCQPSADFPVVQLKGIEDRAFVSGTLTIAPSTKSSEPKPIGTYDLYVDGKRIQRIRPGGKFFLDTLPLDDGFHEVRVVATEKTAVETQGRWIGNVTVKNGRDAVQLQADQSQFRSGMESFTVEVASSSKTPVTVFHNSRELGKVDQGNGKLRVDVETVGTGPITLVALSQGEPGLRSRPLRLVIP